MIFFKGKSLVYVIFILERVQNEGARVFEMLAEVKTLGFSHIDSCSSRGDFIFLFKKITG